MPGMSDIAHCTERGSRQRLNRSRFAQSPVGRFALLREFISPSPLGSYAESLTKPRAWGFGSKFLILRGWLLTGLILALLVLPTVCGASSYDPMKLTRESAVAMAIHKNIDLRVEALDSAMDETRLARSRGIYDPVLTSSISGGQTSYPNERYRTSTTFGSVGLTQYLPTGGSLSVTTLSDHFTSQTGTSESAIKDWQSAVRVSISQPLLKNFGKETTEFNITLAENSLQGSLERFQFFLSDTIFAVITSYDRLYSLRHILEERLSSLKSAETLLKELQLKTTTDLQQDVGIANAKYAISQRRKNMIDAERNLSDQEAHVRYLIGMTEKYRLIPVDPPSLKEPLESEKQAIEMALQFRSDLKQLRLTLETNLFEEKVDQHQLYPDLSLTASGGFSGVSGQFNDTYKQIGQGEGRWWLAGLTLRMPLGNTAAKNDYRQSQQRTEQTRHQITAFEWRVRDAVESDMRSLISARLQRQNTERSLHSAEVRLAEYRKQRELGTGTVKDVLDAENDLVSARNDLADAAERFAYAVALLWRDMGVLLERQNIHVDTAHPEQLTRGALAPDETLELPSSLLQVPIEPSQADVLMQSEKGEPFPLTPEPTQEPLLKVAVKTPESVSGPSVAIAPVPPQAQRKVVTTSQMTGYTLNLGEFTSRKPSGLQKILKSAGLVSVVSAGPPQRKEVIRLFCGSFSSAKEALQRRDSLRQAKARPFIIKGSTGDYRVFAASFVTPDRARSEQKRLASRGVTATLENAIVSLPGYTLTAGSFVNRAQADAAAARLAEQGLHVSVLENHL